VNRFFGETRFGRAALILACAAPALLFLGFLLATLPAVPFHPDEATYIFMSRDLDRILEQGPLAVCWHADGESDPLQVERERDCPLARYAIGWARRLAGSAATEANWNWSLDWEQNLALGAVPSQELLFHARIPEVLLLFLSVLLMARIGFRLGGWMGAVAAAALLGMNSQVLLHARRAMSESGLLFGMILVVAVLLEPRWRAGSFFRGLGRPLLAGAALAIAVSAKYSGLLMMPVAVGGMFCVDPPSDRCKALWHGIARTGMLILAFFVFFLVLNPVYWCNPLGTLSAVVAERQRLMAEQVDALCSASRMAVLDSPVHRLLAPYYEWFVAPPAFWDIPKYAVHTAAAENAYMAQPLHTLTASWAGGLITTVLAFAGLIWAAVRALVRKAAPPEWIAMVWLLSVFFGIVVGVPILWQRYYLPLIPAGAALSAAAIGALVRKIQK
jgi:4-amino-4-deoxy-L-arabinose transferase-like glycosyltransferase